jgi:hypothetical protein
LYQKLPKTSERCVPEKKGLVTKVANSTALLQISCAKVAILQEEMEPEAKVYMATNSPMKTVNVSAISTTNNLPSLDNILL